MALDYKDIDNYGKEVRGYSTCSGEKKDSLLSKICLFFGGSCLGMLILISMVIFFIFSVLNVVVSSCCSSWANTSLTKTDFVSALENSNVSLKYSKEYSRPYEPGVEFADIAVIPLSGVISYSDSLEGINPGKVREILNAIGELGADMVILDIDSPGGEVTASDEIYRELCLFREKHRIPIMTSMRSICASGGYYIAMASDYLMANGTTITGSIGVIMQSFNYQNLMNKIGVSTQVYKSGAMKDILSGSRPTTEAEAKWIQNMVDENYMRFAEVVANGRPQLFDSAMAVKQHPMVGDARVFSGWQAQKHGLVDRVGNLRDAVNWAYELLDCQVGDVYIYKSSTNFFDKLFSVELKNRFLDQMALPQGVGIKPGSMYYLMPMVIQGE